MNNGNFPSSFDLPNVETNNDVKGNFEQDGWLLSYLDVFVLMVALLVIMLDRANTEDKVLPLSDNIIAQVETIEPELERMHSANAMSTNTLSTNTSVSGDTNVLDSLIEITSIINPIGNFRNHKQDLLLELDSRSTDYRVEVLQNNDEISVKLADTLLFDSSEAILKPEGMTAIERLLPTLQRIDQRIVIEGHTDDRPIHTPQFPSNWELAAARANSVLHFLLMNGIDRNRLSAVSYGDTRPLVDNDSHHNRSINRRVNLVLIPEK
ncbi:MAG: OmpA family protein [Pseudomonadales bacterium]|nr:OmpA family protein [Pseudomonadales bacterium]